MGMYGCFKYDPVLQKYIGSKTKPEPWLHARFTTGTDIGDQDTHYVIYVWDTRQVVEQGIAPRYAHNFSRDYRGARQWFIRDTRRPFRGVNACDKLTVANDNGQPLIGGKYSKPLLRYFVDADALQAAKAVETKELQRKDATTYDGKRPRIFRYTADLQKQLQSKIKAEPWLHCFLTDQGTGVIYVWDTRAIVGNIGKISQLPITGELANDNMKPLVGPLADDYDIELAMAEDPEQVKLIRHCKQALDKLQDGFEKCIGLSAGRLGIDKQTGKLTSSLWGDNEGDANDGTIYAVAVTDTGTKPSRFLRSSGIAWRKKVQILVDDQTRHERGMVRIVDILPAKIAIQRYGALTGWSLK